MHTSNHGKRVKIMASITTYACYAALKAGVNGSDIINACLRMVTILVKEKKYPEIVVQTLCKDFLSRFGFPITYHPMHTIIDQGIKSGVFTYNSLKKTVPVWSSLDVEDYMDTVKKKNLEFEELLRAFKVFLKEAYELSVSSDDAKERFDSFISNQGVLYRNTHQVTRDATAVGSFGEFLVWCEDTNRNDIIDSVNDIILGSVFVDLLTYGEKSSEAAPMSGTSVYLDTDIVFRLLGISSADCSKEYGQFIRDMQSRGIRVYVYDHTYSEVMGILVQCEQWIGNYYLDMAKASEATYYFVSKNYTRAEVGECINEVRNRLENEFRIIIDEFPYPKADDIKTPRQAIIGDRLVAYYKRTNPYFDMSEKDKTILYDSMSLFLTLHKNGGINVYSIRDLKNIFITTNKSLAQVGRMLRKDAGEQQEKALPVCMTDIEWGTLFWVNSPMKVTDLSKSRLMADAYAAFKPSEELLCKLSAELDACVAAGDLSPETCYMLKANPLAHRLLMRMTHNNADNYVEKTPFELLRLLKTESYEKGANEEHERTIEERNRRIRAEQELEYERQKSRVSELRATLDRKNSELAHMNDKFTDNIQEVKHFETLKDKLERKHRSFSSRVYVMTASILVLYSAMLIYLYSTNRSTMAEAICTVVPIFLLVVALISRKTWNPKQLITDFLNWAYKERACKLGYYEQSYVEILERTNSCNRHKDELNSEIDLLTLTLQTEENALDNVVSSLQF